MEKKSLMPKMFFGSRILSCIGFLLSVVPSPGASGQEAGPHQGWEAVRLWEVGDLMGPISFSRIGDLGISPEGRLFVSQPSLAEVWEFDLDGNRVSTLGRRGRGPGEFESPNAVFFRGDTLVVWDDRIFLLSYFDSSGRFIESHRAGVMSSDLGVLGDGSIISISASMPTRDLANGRVTELPLRRLPPEGKTSERIALLSVQHWMMEVEIGTGKLYGPQPFADHDLWRVADDGRAMVVIRRRVDQLDSPATFSLSLFDSSGIEVERRDFPFDPIPLDRRTIREAAEGQSREVIAMRVARNLDTPKGAYSPERFRAAYYRPEVQPPVEDIAFGPGGEIWLRRETQAGRSTVPWMVLDANLNVIASVELPADVTIILPAGERVFAARRDEMDVDHLLCFRLSRN